MPVVFSFCLFFRHLISEVAWPVVAELCKSNVGQKCEVPAQNGSPKTSKFMHNFEELHILVANISGVRLLQDIVNQKTAWQTYLISIDHLELCDPLTLTFLLFLPVLGLLLHLELFVYLRLIAGTLFL